MAISISDSTLNILLAEYYANHALLDRFLKTELNSSMIISDAAIAYHSELLKNEYRLKKDLVQKSHITNNGSPRSISYHEGGIKGYPSGYYYTKLGNGRIVKRKTELELLDFLLSYYSITVGDTSIRSVWNLALGEMRRTKTSTQKTFDELEYAYKRYIPDHFSQKDIRNVNEIEIRELCKALVTTRPADAPVAWRFKESAFLTFKGILNIIFNFALRENMISQNPVTKVENAEYIKLCESKRRNALDKTLKPDEIEMILKELSKRFEQKRYHGYYVYGYMIQLAIETGMRAAELCSLKWIDITEDIWIHTQQLEDSKPLRLYEVPWTKNEKKHEGFGRHFPLTKKIKKILTNLKANQNSMNVSSDYVFCNHEGKWISKRQYEKALQNVCKALNLPKTNNHALRMTLNSYVLIPAGIPVTDRAKLLGHSVETNLKYYSFEDKDYVSKACEILDNTESDYLTTTKNVIYLNNQKALTPTESRLLVK